MQSKLIPNFPAIFRLAKHQGDRALVLQIKNLAGPLAVSFFKSMELAIKNSVWAQTNILTVDSVFDGMPDGMPHVFRLVVDDKVCGAVSEEDGEREEVSFALPLPIEVFHWMRREGGFRKIIPFTPPGYCDDYTFHLAFYCHSSDNIKGEENQFVQNLAKSISYSRHGSYEGVPITTSLEYLEMLVRVR